MIADINVRPHYYTIKRHQDGTTDKRGATLMCEAGDGNKAQWTGTRRPRARIMSRTFAFCDECWKRERLR